jgi:ADP-ribose pyrophosphatase YjhB (NUDIX family)
MVSFCQQCGHALEWKEVDGQRVQTCPACGFVSWRNPLVSTVVLIETTAGLILGRRAIEPGYGLWGFPGGYVNEDEHPAVAAARECAEEIGVRVKIESLFGVHHVIRGDGRGLVVIAYRASLEDGEQPVAGHETLEIGHFAPDASPELAFKTHQEVLADYRERTGPAGPKPAAAPRPARAGAAGRPHGGQPAKARPAQPRPPRRP